MIIYFKGNDGGCDGGGVEVADKVATNFATLVKFGLSAYEIIQQQGLYKSI